MADETTTDRLAEIEGQAAEYTPPEGWRKLQEGEVLEGEDWLIDPRNGKRRPTLRLGHKVEHQIYIRRIEPEPTITPDDVAAEALAGVFDQAKAEQQIAELRSEVSHVQGLLGESRKAVNSAALDKADLQHRLDVVSAEWALQAETIRGLQTQVEAVKAELVQVLKDRQALQIELDAREQVPQAVSDRFEEGWDAGTARAVETIAEWLEPLRKLIDAADNVEQTERASNLAADIMQNLPHIMRTLTGLTDED